MVEVPVKLRRFRPAARKAMLLLAFALATPAAAHQAPKGWSYDSECCGGKDCRQIRDDAVRHVSGGWLIVATGQIIPDNQVKHSQDEHFHRCSAYGREDTHTYCLYVPDLTM